MLPSDAPFLETALALLALPFRPVTAGCLFHIICGKYSQCVMPDTRKKPRPKDGALIWPPVRGHLRAVRILSMIVYIPNFAKFLRQTVLYGPCLRSIHWQYFVWGPKLSQLWLTTKTEIENGLRPSPSGTGIASPHDHAHRAWVSTTN